MAGYLSFPSYLTAAAVALWCGLDRTAAGQFMISRPIVAAPLTGWLLGNSMLGLQVGALLELLWLGRLPVGAAIPPDDTQVAVGSTVLAVSGAGLAGLPVEAMAVLSLLIGLPLGKSGEIFDRLARLWNARLLSRAEFLLDAERPVKAGRLHLVGLWHFGLASLATFAVIVGVGTFLLHLALPFLPGRFGAVAAWLWPAFPLVGISATLGTLKVPRSLLLFTGAFAVALVFFGW
jgi:PTS system mannose-specific IIC component